LPRDNSDLVHAFYDGVTAPRAFASAVDLLRAAFDAQASILGVYDPVIPDISLSIASGAWTPDVMQSYMREFVRLDPAPAKYACLPIAKSATSSQLFSAAELRRQIFFNEFLKPAGLVEVLAGRIAEVPGGFAAIGVHRGSRRSPFSADDIAAMDKILPHVARAFQLRRTFAIHSVKAASLASTIDYLTVGVIASSAEGRPLHTNVAARALAARDDGLRLDGTGRCRSRDSDADAHLLALYESVRAGGVGGIVRIRRSVRGAYAALVAPLPSGTGLGGSPGEGCTGVLTLIHDPEAATPAPPDILKAAFGLTNRGAELVAALAAGEGLKEYAERTGLSLHTARFHLKSVFARMGVRTQAQLVRAAVRALTEFALCRNPAAG
jgi:DNA-binding CsgD family transcriptional regulator